MAEKTSIIITAVFSGLLLLVIGLVLWGVFTHKEAGLDRVCWYEQRARWPEYLTPELYNTFCLGDTGLIKWTKYPITVSSDARRKKQQDALLREIKRINSKLGVTFINPDVAFDNVTQADIRVMWDVPWPNLDRLGACSLWKLEDDTLVAQIKVYAMKHDTAMNHVIQHELGHCVLGLAHDSFESSTMYRATSDEMWYSGPRFRDFTRHDIKLVKEHYGF